MRAAIGSGFLKKTKSTSQTLRRAKHNPRYHSICVLRRRFGLHQALCLNAAQRKASTGASPRVRTFSSEGISHGSCRCLLSPDADSLQAKRNPTVFVIAFDTLKHKCFPASTVFLKKQPRSPKVRESSRHEAGCSQGNRICRRTGLRLIPQQNPYPSRPAARSPETLSGRRRSPRRTPPCGPRRRS